MNLHTLTSAERAAAFRTLIANGLTFGDCINAFPPTTNAERAYVAAAQSEGRDGDLEIDSNAVVSLGDDPGAYVMAWVWVDDSSIWSGPTDSDGEPCRFINHYTCDACNETWQDQWSCACDDACPTCGHDYTPTHSIELDITGEPIDITAIIEE